VADTPNQFASHRKRATVLFADISGFTAMSEDLDPEIVREIVNRYFEELSAAVRRYDGTIDKYIGDCVMAVFGVPATHENDPERACRAALDMQQAVRALADTVEKELPRAPELHIGINSGLVVAAPMGSKEASQFTVMGDTVNLASRLCHEAENGQIAVGETTWGHVRERFIFSNKALRSIKGKSEKVPVYFLEAVRASSDRAIPRQPRMVGREREMLLAERLLKDAYAGRGNLLFLTGGPGIGKSRFVSQVSCSGATAGFQLLSVSAQPFETLQPYSMWRQVLEQLSGVAPFPEFSAVQPEFECFLKTIPSEAHHFAALRATFDLKSPEFETLSESGRVQSIVLAWKSLLRHVQSRSPLLLIMDDLQWADPLSVQLLVAISEILPNARVLLCCVARPEFESRWAADSFYHPLTLQPLSQQESSVLIHEAFGVQADSTQMSEVIARAEGNPFYLTELARSVSPGKGEKLPATIEGVILERIDRLESEARRVLELASVIGREFAERLLRSVSDAEEFEDKLHRLRDLDFIYEKEISPELSYLFKHYLTQEATYNSILIRRRKELHKQIANAIETVYKSSLERYYPLLAQHFEKAGNYEKAFMYYNFAGDQTQHAQSGSAAATLYRRGEIALEALLEKRSSLRGKFKQVGFWILAGTAYSIVSDLISHEHTKRLLENAVPVAVLVAVLIVSRVTKWHFLVYPNKITFKSEKESVDIQFDDITKMETISFSVWEWHWYCLTKRDFRRIGLAQSLQVLGNINVLRITCRPFTTQWDTPKNGYELDLDNPTEYLKSFNMAFHRYRGVKQGTHFEEDALVSTAESIVEQSTLETWGDTEWWHWVKWILIAAALLAIVYLSSSDFVAGFKAGSNAE
jgi:class 3 adenylate cyclase